jgi:toluene monooxygenase electron transfer component
VSTGGVEPASPRLQIRIDGGAAFEMAAAEDSLLRGALRAGVALPHECSVGGCGACRFELVEGRMETVWDEAPGLSARDRQRGKRLACQSRPLEDCTIRVRCDDQYRPVVAPSRFHARLAERRRLTDDVAEFTFRGTRPAAFRPGQYALLYLPGVRGARAYSMSNQPNGEGLWRFIVRRVPQGRGTAALFDAVAPGDEIEIDGPYGHAYWRPTGRRLVCVAGGSGLGPMLSIAQAAIAADPPCEVHFFLGLRGQPDLGAGRTLEPLASPRLRVSTVLSAPLADPAWAGATGYVHDAVERSLPADLADLDFYFAGPPPMIEALHELLMVRRKVSFDRIHFDRFV